MKSFMICLFMAFLATTTYAQNNAPKATIDPNINKMRMDSIKTVREKEAKEREDKNRSETPAPVQEAFQKEFPAAKYPIFNKRTIENVDYYLARVNEKGYYHELRYDAKGILVEKKSEVDLYDLPAKIIESFKKNFTTNRILSAKSISENSVIKSFELNIVSSDGKRSNIQMSKDGAIIEAPKPKIEEKMRIPKEKLEKKQPNGK